jgi:hypothetical protein
MKNGLRADPVYPLICAQVFGSAMSLLAAVKEADAAICFRRAQFDRVRSGTYRSKREPEENHQSGGVVAKSMPNYSTEASGMQSRMKQDNKGGTVPGRRRGIVCYVCREEGHIASSCPNRDRQRASAPRAYHTEAAQQPVIEEDVEGASVNSITMNRHGLVSVAAPALLGDNLDLLLDTGSDVSILQKRFLKADCSLKSSRVREILALGKIPVEVVGEVDMEISEGESIHRVRFLVVDDGDMESNGILGRDFMRLNKIRTINLDIDPEPAVTVCNVLALSDGQIGDDDNTRSWSKVVKRLLEKSYLEYRRPLVPEVTHDVSVRL